MTKKSSRIKQDVDTTKSDQRDVLAGSVMDALNKKFDSGAFEFLSEANLISEWVSTGNEVVDLFISNRRHGGLGYGSFVEFFGLPGSGKSLLAAHCLSETQKQGGLSVLFDTEKAVGMLDFYKSVGLDTTSLLYTDKLRALEDVFSAMVTIIEKYVEKGSDRKLTIVIDSIMGATTNVELESGFSLEGFTTAKSRILSSVMRRLPSMVLGRNILIIFINQLKENIGAVGFGAEKYKTTGGTSIPFTCHVRLKLTKGNALKDKSGEIGHKLHIKTVKNRFGPKNREVIVDAYYDHGIDKYESWLAYLKMYDIITGTATKYRFNTVDVDSGELIEYTFSKGDFPKFIRDNPEIKDAMYEALADRIIMKYRIGSDDGGDNETIDELIEVNDD